MFKVYERKYTGASIVQGPKPGQKAIKFGLNTGKITVVGNQFAYIRSTLTGSKDFSFSTEFKITGLKATGSKSWCFFALEDIYSNFVEFSIGILFSRKKISGVEGEEQG